MEQAPSRQMPRWRKGAVYWTLAASWLREEMAGEGQAVGLLMVHAQDHLSGAGMARDLGGLIIRLCEQVAELEGKL